MQPAEAAPSKRALKYQRRNARKKAEREAREEAAISLLPPPTDHARMRWAERFRPDESFAVAYANSRPVTWAELRKKVKGAGLVFRLHSSGEFRQDATTGAVFVIGGTPPMVRTVVRIKL